MPALKLNDVPARVAAWHNRHPLARRIDPSQVHSIGGLGLPFASDVPAPAPPPPTLTEVIDPVAPVAADAAPGQVPAPPAEPAAQAARDSDPPEPGTAADAAPTEPAGPAADAADTPAPPPGAEPDAEPELVLVEAAAGPDAGSPADRAAGDDTPEGAGDPAQAADAGDTAGQAVPPADPEAEPSPAPPTETPDAAADAQAPAEPAAKTPGEAARPDSPAAPAAASPLAARLEAARSAARQGLDAAPAAPGADGQPWWRRLWPWPRADRAQPLRRGAGASTPGAAAGHAGRLAPLFDPDLLAPLAPRQIARWLKRHGEHAELAPAGWPRRLEPADPVRLAAQRSGRARHALTLHMLTAAIDIGPRRVRVLIDAQGHILGPRLISPWRVLASGAALSLALGLVGVAWWQNQRALADGPALAALAAASAASAASAAPPASPAPAPSGAEDALASPASAEASAAHDHAGSPAPPAAPTAEMAASSAAATIAARQPDAHAATQPWAPAPAPAAPVPPPVPDHAGPPTPSRQPPGAGAHALVPPEVLLSGRWQPGPDTGSPGAAAPMQPPAATGGTGLPATSRHGGAGATDDGLTLTTVPPPRFPERRASGPVARIRPVLSDEERALARAQSEAARAAARGLAAAPAPGASAPAPAAPGTAAATTTTAPAAAAPAARAAATRAPAAPAAAAAPARLYAVVADGAADRDTAEAQLAQMMSVRARLPAPGPAFTELLPLDGRWRAAQWPFATEAEANRAREMLAARGLKAQVVNF